MSNDKFKEYHYKDIVQAIMMRDGIHEGLWQLQVNVGFGATNVKSRDEQGNEGVRPAAFVTINHFALSRVDTKTDMSFDAQELNPMQAKKRTTKETTSSPKREVARTKRL